MASFRFWIGRSTIDALMNLKRWPVGMTSQGEKLLAVFLDIANAFNGLLLGVIREALLHFGVPLYLRWLL